MKLVKVRSQMSEKNVIQEIQKVELTIFNVRKELKTLKKRIAGYKGWTKRYRKQQKELRQDKLELQQELSTTIQERDAAVAELNKLKLSSSVREAIVAKEQRDRAIAELDILIDQIEEYKKVCENLSQVKYANKKDLIRKAETILFDDTVLPKATNTINEKDDPQMFTDRASVCRDLLDR